METKRIFIGTFVDSKLFEPKLEELRNEFDACCNGKWVEPGNLHFTYQFLGNVKVKDIDDIKKSLEEFLINYNSNLIFKGISALPKPNFPRILYIKTINDEGTINIIQKKMEEVLTKFGFQPDKRGFSPHITIERIKKFDRTLFLESLEKYNDYEIGEMSGFKIDLVESHLTKEGPIYSKI